MNLVVAALLDVHAKIAAETRGEKPQPEAKWALRTEVKNGSSEDTDEDIEANRQVRLYDEQGQR
jgi:hypothetical protein